MAKTIFGKYEVIKKVAAGGMAELFLARQTGIEGFEKLIAIKRILPELAEGGLQSELVQMFLDEARLAARLNHPHIVQILDLGKAGNEFFIAMEYVNGVDLRRLMRRADQRQQPIPTAHAVKILSYVCEALTYAHGMLGTDGKPLGLVHRDVSPQNVMLSFDGGVKLTDFGIAKAASQVVKTRAGIVKGKLNYMSPEQVSGEVLDSRSDLFSVGILLYELTTGERPFPGKSDFEVMEAIAQRPQRNPLEVRADYPRGLLPILDRALAKAPAQRYADALALQMDLERFLVEERAMSNATLIGQFVRSLFDDVLAVQAQASGRALSTADIVASVAGEPVADSRPLPAIDEAPHSPETAQDAATAAPIGAAAEVAETRAGRRAVPSYRRQGSAPAEGKGPRTPVPSLPEVTPLLQAAPVVEIAPPVPGSELTSEITARGAEAALALPASGEEITDREDKTATLAVQARRRPPAPGTDTAQPLADLAPLPVRRLVAAMAALVVICLGVAVALWPPSDARDQTLLPGHQDATGGGALLKPTDAAPLATRLPAPDAARATVALPVPVPTRRDAGARPDAARPSTPPSTPPPVPTPRPEPRQRPTRAVAHPTPAKPSEAARAPGGTGFLTIDSEPWSEVWLGGQKLGVTPLAYQKLPEGRHRLILKNSREGLEKGVTVKISAEEVTTLKVELRQP